MGTKYASIHILTAEPDRVLATVKRHYDQDDSLQATMGEVGQIIKDAALLRVFQGLLAAQKPLLVQSGLFVSLYDESLSFESVEEKAQALSSIVAAPVVYTSNFDDDVFLFGVYRSGERVTGGNFGQGLESYGIAPEAIDIARFHAELGISDAGAMERLNALQDVFAVQDEIERWLQVPLHITIDDVRSDSRRYVRKPEGGRVHVYERL
mgnify:CR=1 FL=1